MRDVLLTIASTNYQAELSSVAFTPSSSTTTWKGLTPTAVFNFATTATWTADLTFAVDWDTSTSLARYLFAHEGETQTIVFRPKGTGYSGMTANVIITPGAIGGSVDSVSEATVSLPIQGRPTFL
jgi:hypothetical protein